MCFQLAFVLLFFSLGNLRVEGLSVFKVMTFLYELHLKEVLLLRLIVNQDPQIGFKSLSSNLFFASLFRSLAWFHIMLNH